MVYPCLIVLLLLVASTVGILAIEQDVESDARRQGQIVELLTNQKLHSDQMVLDSQIQDVDTAIVSSSSLLDVALKVVSTTSPVWNFVCG